MPFRLSHKPPFIITIQESSLDRQIQRLEWYWGQKVDALRDLMAAHARLTPEERASQQADYEAKKAAIKEALAATEQSIADLKAVRDEINHDESI